MHLTMDNDSEQQYAKQQRSRLPRRYSSTIEDPLEASEAYGFDRLLTRKVHGAAVKLRAISLFKQAGADHHAAAIKIQMCARSQKDTRWCTGSSVGARH